MYQYLITIAFLSSVVFIIKASGSFSSAFSNFLVYILIGVFVFSLTIRIKYNNGNEYRNKLLYKIYFLQFIIFIISIIAFSILSMEVFIYKLLFLIIVCFVIGKLNDWLKSSDKSLNDEDRFVLTQNSTLFWALGITSFLFGIFFYLVYFEPSFWYILQGFSQDYSKISGRAFNLHILFNPTAAGFFITLLFIVFGISAFSLSSKHQWSSLILYSILLFVINCLFTGLVDWMSGLFQGFSEHVQINPTDLLIFLLFLDFIPLYFFLKGREFNPVVFSIKPGSLVKFIIVLFCFIISSGIYLISDLQIKKLSKKILVYNKGYFDLEKPTFGKYGLNSGGMFGMLPLYLDLMGYKVTIDSVLSSNNLDSNSIVIIINLNKTMPENEKNTLREFIYRGNSLLVMGDHTGVSEMMHPLNSLLDFVNIKFKFDCGHYLKRDWKNSFEFFSNPIFSNIKDEQDITISVGASLDFSPLTAKTLLNAKYGFSDWGNPDNQQNAYLGDRKYNTGELLGDIALIALAEYGKGKVIVFGDTAPFQNGALCYSNVFVKNIFDYLSYESFGWSNFYLRISAFFMFIIGLFLLFIFEKKPFEPVLVLWVGIMIFLILLVHRFLINYKNDYLLAQNSQKIAYIDASHVNQFTQYGEDGIWALSYNLIRNNYVPFVYRQFLSESFKSSNLSFFISPIESLNKKEVQLLEDYVKNGNTLIWSVGFEEKASSQNVLERFGFDIDNIPLGPIPSTETLCRNTLMAGLNNIHPLFYNAWPIICKDEYMFYSYDTLCTGYNYPVIVSKTIGKGKFILISDSGFLLSKNLEIEDKYSIENIFFLKKLVETN